MAHVKNDILNRLIKMLKEPHNNILSNYKKRQACVTTQFPEMNRQRQ